jgi:hypothetical protein
MKSSNATAYNTHSSLLTTHSYQDGRRRIFAPSTPNFSSMFS